MQECVEKNTRARRGNPANLQRGIVVRATVLTLAAKGTPLPDVMQTLGLSRVRVLNILAALRQAGRISAYTTRGRVVRAWR